MNKINFINRISIVLLILGFVLSLAQIKPTLAKGITEKNATVPVKSIGNARLCNNSSHGVFFSGDKNGIQHLTGYLSPGECSHWHGWQDVDAIWATSGITLHTGNGAYDGSENYWFKISDYNVTTIYDLVPGHIYEQSTFCHPVTCYWLPKGQLFG